jgi:energy-coupling factor transport system permease protein
MIVFGLTAMVLDSITDDFFQFSALFFTLILIHYLAKLPIKSLLKEMNFFYVMIPLIIFLSSFNFMPNPALFLDHFNLENLLFGITFSAKLILFAFVSTLFIETTSIREITYSLEWFFHPIPFIKEADLALMINLTLTQIPVIFDTFSQVKIAQKSRCNDYQKNPIKKMVSLIIPVFTKIMKNVNELEFAYHARCYNGEKTKHKFNATLSDYFFLTIFCVICGLILFI